MSDVKIKTMSDEALLGKLAGVLDPLNEIADSKNEFGIKGASPARIIAGLRALADEMFAESARKGDVTETIVAEAQAQLRAVLADKRRQFEEYKASMQELQNLFAGAASDPKQTDEKIVLN